MKIIFFGNWNLGYLTLSKLLQEDFPISMVVTNFDVNDEDVYRNKVYELACQSNLPVYKSYREILDYIDQGDIGFSVAYGNEIFKVDILEKVKIYNFHPSFLPYYKGPSPIQWQIKNREKEWGMTCHEVDAGIDTGKIIKRDKYALGGTRPYEAELDEYNQYFSVFIVSNIKEIIAKVKDGKLIEGMDNRNLREDYKPHLSVPKDMWNSNIDQISDYLNQKRILFFAANRAELGILFPLILETSRRYYVDLMVLDTYLLSGEDDLYKKKQFIKKNNYRVNFIKITIKNSEDVYFDSLSCVYKKVFAYLKKQEQYPYKFAVVLGDRIESLGFTLAVFYGKVPVVHVAGGDVAEVPYFDNSVRHCISKLANLHFPFSEKSARVLKQMGEEENRICMIGNPSFDYDRLQLIPSKQLIDQDFHIGNGFCTVFTYHAGPLKTSRENLIEYKECLQGVLDSEIERIIITFPNHDHGSEEVLAFLSNLADTERITVVRSLGTENLHSLMKNFKTIIAGNSSMGLLETAYYMCPVLNIGDRQTCRARGRNVTDVCAKREDITEALNYMIRDYERNREQFRKDGRLFGDGNAAVKALDFLKMYEKVSNEELIVKKFVKRM